MDVARVVAPGWQRYGVEVGPEVLDNCSAVVCLVFLPHQQESQSVERKLAIPLARGLIPFTTTKRAGLVESELMPLPLLLALLI
jgi:hypothetical protein